METIIRSNRKEEIIDKLKQVIDPELRLDIYKLGLIYNVEEIDSKELLVTMTLTSPMCPFGPLLIAGVQSKLKELGYEGVKVALSFDPIWEPSEDLKMELGLL